jgi:hypothetical protein
MTNSVHRSGGDVQPVDTRMIMLIRHAEKPLHPSRSPHGVDPEGQHDPHSLTVTGWVRAGALVELFAPSRGTPPTELIRPDTVYASAHAGGHSKRSLQTVGPLAARLGLEVVKRYAAGDEAHLAKEISTRPGAPSSPGTTKPSTKSPTTCGTCTRSRPGTGRTTASTSSGRSRRTATGGASPRSRSSCCPVTCPTPSPTSAPDTT